MTKTQRLVAVVMGAVLSVPGVLFASILYFDAMGKSEYASGIRTSTDGDSIMIPVVGVTVAWTILLLLVGGIAGAVLLIRRARQNAA